MSKSSTPSPVDNSVQNVDKSARKPVPKGLVPFRKGHDPRRGNGPKKGAPNAGRQPDEIRALSRQGYAEAIPKLRRVALGETVTASLTLHDGTTRDIEIRPDASAMARAADILGKYGALTQVEVTGDPLAPLVVRFEE